MTDDQDFDLRAEHNEPDLLVDRIDRGLTRQANDELARVKGLVRERPGLPEIPLEQLLAFEAKHHRHQGAKEEAIRSTFGRSATRYYQALNRAIDTREALELNPMLVNRLRDTRARRLKERASRTFRPNR